MTQLVPAQNGLNKCLSKWTLPIGMGQQKQIAQGNSANLQKIDNHKRVAKILPASNQKYFDKDLKSYIYSLEPQNSKICLPGVEGQQLALNQRYLILNVFILLGQPWTLEIGLTDINGIKRRVNMTTIQGKNQTKYFSMRYHLQNIERGVWLFLGINVHSFIEPFKGQVFRSLDSITVGNGCLIRRVFTMKEFVEWQIPKNFWLSPQIPQQLQLISYQQRTLPNIHKSIHNDPPLSPPTKSIKHSKSSMVRSQVTNRILAKSKLSEDRGIFGEGHIKINVKNTIIGQQRIKKMVSCSPLSEKKSMKDKERNKYGKYERKIERIEKEIERISGSQSKETQKQGYILKIPSKRSPILQKSFQEDEAFKNEIEDLSSHVEIRNVKNSKRPIKTQKQERWEQDQEFQSFPTPSKQKQSKPISNLSKLSTIPKTILTKQNQTKMEGQEQKVQLQLIYDEMVGCYYHPQTNTFYELKS